LHRAQEIAVSTLRDLFTTSYGLMSGAVIVFLIGMGVFMTRFVRRHMEEDARRAGR
jgi:hypothetical protein